MDYKSLTEDLVHQCLKKGADAAEVYLQSGRNLNISIRNSVVETIQENASKGVGFRVIADGRMGFAHSNDLSTQSLKATLASAIDFAKILSANEYNGLPSEAGISEVKGLYDPQIAKVSLDCKMEMAKEVEALAVKHRKVTKSAGSRYFERDSEIFLANSNGLIKSYRSASCGYGVSVVAEKGDQKCTGGEFCSRRFIADLEMPENLANKAAKEAYSMLDPRRVRTQKAAVIFDPSVARSILGGVLGALNGQRISQGASFLWKKLDRKFASDLVTLIDDGLRPKGLASAPFDGEGVPTQRRVLVDKGILKGFMYNTIAAKRANTRSTGNASRGGYTRLPGIGAHNFYMEAGSHTPKNIIQQTRRGLLLTGVTGYGINSVSGNFSGGASGFWIENGRITFPVKGLTIAGTALDMLNNIDMVGNDLDLNKSFTAPTFRIREMLIGGE
ncbi:TldD/PmbA family protein [bacterium]|nr:TldD/PmbA family protein [bacterium]